MRFFISLRLANKSHAHEHFIIESKQQQRINQNTNLFNLFKFEVNRKRKIANISQNKSRARHLEPTKLTATKIHQLTNK